MFREGNLRASDADRELAVSMLQQAAAEGRLDHDELDERVQRALRARTYAQLAATVIDLPLPHDGGRRSRREPPPAWAVRRGRGAGLRAAAGAAVGGWMVRAVRRNPSLLLVLVPMAIVATMFAMCLAVMWLTVMAVALACGRRPRIVAVDPSRDWAVGSSRAWALRAFRRTSF
jgi:hypothetical protein